MVPKEKQKIEIEKTQRDPLLSFNQAVTANCSDFLGTALFSDSDQAGQKGHLDIASLAAPIFCRGSTGTAGELPPPLRSIRLPLSGIDASPTTPSDPELVARELLTISTG